MVTCLLLIKRGIDLMLTRIFLIKLLMLIGERVMRLK
jgi:hypothetical protein